jgi:hypothetical protein
MINTPTKKKYNSSMESASISLGVHASVIDMFLPAMIEATKTINEQIKIKANRESLQNSQS